MTQRLPKNAGLGQGPVAAGWLLAVLLAVLLVVPFACTVRKSTQQLDPARPSSYGRSVGAGNFVRLFEREPEFVTSLVATAQAIGIAAVQFLAAVAFAAWLRCLWPTRLPSLLVVLLLTPLLVSPTLVALWGRLALHDQVGVVSRLLRFVKILGPADAPLGTSTGAWWSIAFLDAWQWIPFTTLLVWLCFRLVPDRQLESAKVDGLSGWRTVTTVYLPSMAGPLVIVLLFRTLEALRIFDIPQLLTGGGPGVKTMTASLFAHRITFVQQRFGMGAAHLVLLEVTAYALILLLVSRLRSLRRLILENRA